MIKKKILIVAHPDDEVLFFSSILKDVDKIIVCFGPSNDEIVSEGRKLLQKYYPLQNIEWLNLKESNVLLTSNWNNPCITKEGVEVNKSKKQYIKNFKELCMILKKKIEPYEIIYTHNPWGEYGHEEHVSIFNVVLSLFPQNNKKLFVSCYVSDLSKKLFLKRKYLLDNNLEIGVVPQKFCDDLKNLYSKYNCWTWKSTYKWPKSEIFSSIKISQSSSLKGEKIFTVDPPILMFSYSFSPKLFIKFLPKKIKTIIKIILSKVKT